MRIKQFIGLASVCLALAACQSSSYQIKGNAKELKDGDTLFITSDLYHRTPIDTTFVSDGTFEFAGNVDSTRICMVYAARQPEMNITFFLAPADIRIILRREGSRVQGPRINDDWQELNDTIDYYGKEMKEMAMQLFENTQIPIDEKQQLMGKMKALEDLLKQKIRETADRHREDELGQFIHSHFQD